ncbi:MAG: DUF6065 family protein [Gemmataceae bacterium]
MKDAPISRDIIAYETNPHPGVPIIPAPVDRAWMDQTGSRFAYRCLPLNIANQNGWQLLNRTEFEVYWYGGSHKSDIEIRFIGNPDNHALSHFGDGVLTFAIPYIFRTPRGVNIWVKGPSNYVKDGIQPLEGIVETDWNPATFTMNWKFTRPFEWIRFRKDEPICTLVPIPRGFTESFTPRRTAIESNLELMEEHQAWSRGRSEFLDGLQKQIPEVVARSWQKDYFQGKKPDGESTEDHQTRLDVKPFPDTLETPVEFQAKNQSR